MSAPPVYIILSPSFIFTGRQDLICTKAEVIDVTHADSRNVEPELHHITKSVLSTPAMAAKPEATMTSLIAALLLLLIFTGVAL